MKISLLLFLVFFTCTLSYSQSQFGLTSGISSINFKSTDLIFSGSGTGLSIGLSYLSYLKPKSDLLIDFSYELKSFTLNSYKDFEGNSIEFEPSNELKINSFNLAFLLNQYLITPDNNTFHFGFQGGLGATMLDNWNIEDQTLFDDIFPISPYFLLGITSGTEQLRVSLRYINSMGNILKNITVEDNQNEFFPESRELRASNRMFALLITYYFKPFYR